MDTVTGNGHITTETRSAAGFTEVSFGGPFEAVIETGKNFGISVEADENLMPYINFDKDGDKLKVKIRDGINIRSRHGIKVRISMPKVAGISFAGSGKVKVEGTIRDIDELGLSVAGSGDINADIDCPRLKAEIAGAGTITTSGKSRDVEVDIAGSGDYKGADLLSERVKVSIAGSGSAWLYASLKLDISIAGSGDIYYRGSPEIKQSVAGSGNVKKLD
jgi:hypothetical protein